jgi:hypothetical protein
MLKKGKGFKSILVYPSDKNGCGFYRNFFPLRYLSAISDTKPWSDRNLPNYQITEFFAYNFDLNYIRNSSWVRFQRQVTDAQLKLMKAYRNQIKKNSFATKIAYDLDDLAHAIQPNNIMAYRFYTPRRKRNMIEMFKMSDVVTFSTQYLKNYYEEYFNIKHSVVVPNYLPRSAWGLCGQRNKYNKGKKFRILWSGSASHLGKGGDLEFLLPLMKKTKNEFEWIFQGCIPPELTGNFEFHDWANVIDFPQFMDRIDADVAIGPISDCEFNYGKSDLKLLEYSALGLPGIFSSIGKGAGPYDLIEGLHVIENKSDDWYMKLKEFEKNTDIRMEALEAGQRELSSRWLEDNIELYVKIFN